MICEICEKQILCHEQIATVFTKTIVDDGSAVTIKLTIHAEMDDDPCQLCMDCVREIIAE